MLSQRLHTVTYLQFSWALKEHEIYDLHPETSQPLLDVLLQQRVMVFPHLKNVLLGLSELPSSSFQTSESL